MPRPILPPLDLVTPDTPLRLAAAAAIAFPDGSMSAAILKSEADKGRLAIERIGRLLPHLRRWERRGDVAPVTWYGRPVLRISKAFRRLAIDAGMPDVTPHTLRHTAATWLMQAGTDLWEAAGYLGMSTLTLTRVYGHHHPDHLKRASEAIGRRIGGGTSGGGICGEVCGGQRQRR